jgi:hypothetical protein
VSEPCLSEPQANGEFAVLGAPKPMEFDGQGNLLRVV